VPLLRTNSTPPPSTVVLVATPVEFTCSKPPDLIVALLRAPPLKISPTPSLPMIVLVAAPAEKTN
jgi:hypothetical protein